MYSKEQDNINNLDDLDSLKKTIEDNKTGVKNKNYNSFLCFCCALITGCGQMYLGLTKRGLIFLSTFFACGYLGNWLNVFFLVQIIIWFFGFFDTFNMKKQIENGQIVSDDIDDLKEFFNNNKNVICIAVAIMVILDAVSKIHFRMLGKNAILVVLILFGIYCLNKKRKI